MSLTFDAKNSMLAKIVGKASPAYNITDISLHTADPGTTGDNEVSGGSTGPGGEDYARVSVTEADFTTPSSGETELNNDKDFNGPANEDVFFFGLWDTNDFLGYGSITGDNQYNYLGNYILKQGTSIDLNG